MVRCAHGAYVPGRGYEEQHCSYCSQDHHASNLSVDSRTYRMNCVLQVLDMKFSDFKNAGYPTTEGDLKGENQNPNGK
jgi:hypothetical protein